VVFDDGECFEGFPQTNAVGNDAAAKAVELVDSTHNAISLEFEELVPDHRVADACGGLHYALFIQPIVLFFEELMENQVVQRGRRALFSNLAQDFQ